METLSIDLKQGFSQSVKNLAGLVFDGLDSSDFSTLNGDDNYDFSVIASARLDLVMAKYLPGEKLTRFSRETIIETVMTDAEIYVKEMAEWQTDCERAVYENSEY